MRIYIKTTPNKELVPFNYQPRLVGALHKWIGENTIHDQLSLYSLSWLDHGNLAGTSLNFPEGGSFFISSPSTELVKKLIDGIQNQPEIAFGMKIMEIVLKPTPTFSNEERFLLQSPVLIKRSVESNTRFFFPEDEEANQLLTGTMKNKLEKAGIHPNIKVQFDSSYLNPRKKVSTYKGIQNKGTLCPIIINGDPEAIGFAWEVGVGNSTGIGFGALR